MVATLNQINDDSASKEMLGKLTRNGVKHMWTFPTIYIQNKRFFLLLLSLSLSLSLTHTHTLHISEIILWGTGGGGVRNLVLN